MIITFDILSAVYLLSSRSPFAPFLSILFLLMITLITPLSSWLLGIPRKLLAFDPPANTNPVIHDRQCTASYICHMRSASLSAYRSPLLSLLLAFFTGIGFEPIFYFSCSHNRSHPCPSSLVCFLSSGWVILMHYSDPGGGRSSTLHHLLIVLLSLLSNIKDLTDRITDHLCGGSLTSHQQDKQSPRANP